MSWEPIKKNTMLPRTQANGVAVNLGRTKARKATALTVRFGSDVIAECGWAIGTKLQPALGRLSDDGLLRLAPGSGGYVLRKSGNACISAFIQIPAHWVAARETQPMTDVTHKLVDGALLIVLPTWARAQNGKGGSK